MMIRKDSDKTSHGSCSTAGSTPAQVVLSWHDYVTLVTLIKQLAILAALEMSPKGETASMCGSQQDLIPPTNWRN